MKIPVNVPPCPQCGRSMRAHCPSKYCGWFYCGICAVTLDRKTGRITRAYTGGM